MYYKISSNIFVTLSNFVYLKYSRHPLQRRFDSWASPVFPNAFGELHRMCLSYSTPEILGHFCAYGVLPLKQGYCLLVLSDLLGKESIYFVESWGLPIRPKYLHIELIFA